MAGGSDEQALGETGDILQMMKQLPGCEEADDVDIQQWILAEDCDVGHHMYTDNDIVSLYCRRKVVKLTRMKVIQTKLQRK
jgi:hypothetical protein